MNCQRESTTSGPTNLSILVMARNARHFLDACLNSVRENVTVAYEVILVDDASTDDTSEFVRARFPWVRLIRSEERLGFIKGNNVAAREARGTYLLLLNSDTVLMSDIAPAVQLLQADSRVGVVGARMYGGHGERRPSTGHFPKPMLLWKFGWLWSTPEKHPFKTALQNTFKVDWVEGSFLMTTMENWRALGGLDESNFFYGDDIEFCRSTANRGLLTAHCADVKYKHFGGYEASRLGYLYAGFRRYHRKFSQYPEQLLADFVLRVGLFFRIAVFGVYYMVTRKSKAKEKFHRCWDVNKRWKETNSFAPRFT